MSRYTQMLLAGFEEVTSMEGLELSSKDGHKPLVKVKDDEGESSSVEIQVKYKVNLYEENEFYKGIVDTFLNKFGPKKKDESQNDVSMESNDVAGDIRLFKLKEATGNFTNMNYVLDGVYLPDNLGNDTNIDIELITSDTLMDDLNKDTIYIVVDEYNSSSLVDGLTEQGFKATDSITELEDLVQSFNNIK